MHAFPTQRLLRRLIAPGRIAELVRFCIVGGIGFLVDAAALETLVRAGLAAPMARVLSILVAMQVTFALHARFTYRAIPLHARHTRRRAWMAFILTNGIGALINYLVFLLVLARLWVGDGMLSRQLALVCGTAVALGFNYWANRRFAFAARKHE